MQNILVLNYEYPPLGGGAGNATYYLLKELSMYPHLQVDLITSSANKFQTEKFAENIRIHFLDINKQNKELHYQTNKNLLTYTSKAYFYARKLHKQESYDLCHAFFGIPCGYIAMLLGLPYIVSLRGSDVPFYNKRFYWLDRFVLKKLSNNIWEKAEKVVANSEGLKDLAQKSVPEQEISVIHNGVDMDKFYPAKSKTVSERLRLVSTGRLIERKGYNYLIKALEDNHKVELTLIGEGHLKDDLKELAEKNKIKVKFLDRVAHDNIPDLLRNSDLFILPSLNEGMSNAVLEAMACGLPVIVTDTGGSKELINGNGFIVNKADQAALKKSINQFIDNPALIKTMGSISRKLAEKMSWGNVASSYMDIYMNLCKTD